MFTGLIEAIGTVEALEPAGDSRALEIRTPLDPGPVGASLAVDGVCLTVVRKLEGGLEVVLGPETLRCTRLGELARGEQVNLERPIAMGERLGGHLVLGHVDGVGKIMRMIPQGAALELRVSAPAEVMRYVIHKGSIAIDGVSLTVNGVTETELSITLIPHTLEATTLLRKREGSKVHLEADVIGKYVERFVSTYRSGIVGQKGITLDFLREHGFAD